MATLFSRIANGEIPSYKVAEDEKFYAFLDINPVAKGHTLVIPRIETDYFFDLDDEMLVEMVIFAKRVASQIKKVTNCKKVAMLVLGLEIPHAHIHLIPLNHENEIDFSKPRVKLSDQEFKEIASALHL